MFLSFVLSLPNAIHRFEIVWNHKLPIAETLAKHFFGFPTEELLRGRRPPQHLELVVPFDDCERSVLDVKRESPVIVERSRLGNLSFR